MVRTLEDNRVAKPWRNKKRHTVHKHTGVVIIEVPDNFVAKRGRQVINMKGPFPQ
jgi:hypothetical protein